MKTVLIIAISTLLAGAGFNVFADDAPLLPGEVAESAKDAASQPVQPPASGHEHGNLGEHGVLEMLTLESIDEVLARSADEPVLVFKHSTDCSISGGAYRRMAAYLKQRGDDAPKAYLVKVIERRPVSLALAERVAVEHESPQILLLKDGKVEWHTSHDEITADAVETALRRAPGGKASK